MSGIDVGRTKILHLHDERGFRIDRGICSQWARDLWPANFGAGDLLLQSIGAVIIGGTSIFGGRGGVLRSALGVFVVAFMVNGLNLLAISTFIQEVIVGAIIILSVWLNSLHRSGSTKNSLNHYLRRTHSGHSTREDRKGLPAHRARRIFGAGQCYSCRSGDSPAERDALHASAAGDPYFKLKAAGYADAGKKLGYDVKIYDAGGYGNLQNQSHSN